MILRFIPFTFLTCWLIAIYSNISSGQDIKFDFEEKNYKILLLQSKFTFLYQRVSKPGPDEPDFDIGIESSKKTKIQKEIERLAETEQENTSAISKTLTQLNQLRGRLNKDPSNFQLKAEVEETQKKLTELVNAVYLKYEKVIEENLPQAQIRQLQGVAHYLATYQILLKKKYIPEGPSGRREAAEDDRFLHWPAWIAEELHMNASKIELLEEAARIQKKRLEKNLKRKTQNKLRISRITMTKERQNALTKLIEAIPNEKNSIRQNIVDQILLKSSYGDLELLPSQKQAIKNFKQELDVALKENNSTAGVKIHLQTIKKTAKVLKNYQHKLIDEMVQSKLKESWTEFFPKHYKPLITAAIEKENRKSLQKIYLKIDANLLADRRIPTKEITEAASKILKVIPNRDAKKIKRFMGDRRCWDRFPKSSSRRSLVEHWKVYSQTPYHNYQPARAQWTQAYATDQLESTKK